MDVDRYHNNIIITRNKCNQTTFMGGDQAYRLFTNDSIETDRWKSLLNLIFSKIINIDFIFNEGQHFLSK